MARKKKQAEGLGDTVENILEVTGIALPISFLISWLLVKRYVKILLLN